MKRNSQKRKRKTPNRLLLDAIYNSNSPEVEAYLAKVIHEEFRHVPLEDDERTYARNTDSAMERIRLRIAWKFKHMLSPRMQRLLEERYPQPVDM